ncbi:MAG: peptidase T [Phycisphaerae bacterium]
MNQLLERFCRYVRVETTAVEGVDDYPSSKSQLDLSRMLADELKELGLQDVSMSEFGIVMGTIPATAPDAPTIAWFAHVDTSPEFTGKDVKPTIHENYDGQDIVLPGDPTKIIRTSESKGLADLKGKTIITTDGTTLLGADDKAGVAIIMTAAADLMNDTSKPRGPVRVVFTCDEEIGKGTDKVNLAEVDAIAGYTLDGEASGQIENETFSADLATVKITGRNIHPAIAKDRMTNAIRVAADFVSRLPADRLAPEVTEGRDGFLHPYVIEGGVPELSLRILLRSFDSDELVSHADLLRSIASEVEARHQHAKIEVDVLRQYRNMKEYLEKEPRAVELAARAMRNLGVEPTFHSIRGGTDGSRFSELGLPTPNLSAGMHNFHSPLEYACLEEMQSGVDTLIELARLWSEERK